MAELGEVPKEQLREIDLEYTKRTGESMGVTVEAFFSRHGMDTSNIHGGKILSLDVSDGAEIAAFERYKPAHMIVSENVADIDDAEEQEHVEDTLQRLVDISGSEWIQENPIFTLETLKDRGEKDLSLITFFNIFPSKLTPDYLSTVYEQALPLLQPEGIVLFSVQEPDELGVLQDTATQISTHPETKFSVVDTFVPKRNGQIELAAPGSYVLLAQKR